MGKALNGACVSCKDVDLSTTGCQTCVNMSEYRTRDKDNNLQDQLRKDAKESETESIVFPGPGKIRNSPIYGNYVVASRRIEAGELIIREGPLLVAPYGPSDQIPYCLSCYKDIALSASSKCRKCRWPVCGKLCEKKLVHSSNECVILSKSKTRSRGLMNEYFAIETLRCLLLRDKNPLKWKKVLKFEPHLEGRREDNKAMEVLHFIVDFIREKCNLKDFDAEIIDHVVGVLSVNTFWAFNDLQRYASCLFDKVTLFAHSCDPNTNRSLIEFIKEGEDFRDADCPEKDYYYHASGIGIEIIASRTIEKGDMITIRYVDIGLPVHERRSELKETFYFDCTCDRCLGELMEDQLHISTDGDTADCDENYLNNNFLKSSNNGDHALIHEIVTSKFKVKTCDKV